MSKFVTLHGFGGGVDPILQDKTVIPSTNSQSITADEGYDGLGVVTIDGDTNLIASNIKKDVSIFGITGSYENTDLNFEVVGGTTEPTNPTENTIWVNTEVPITEYHFNSVEPESVTEGVVWFKTDITSNASFNALKENNLTVHPVNTKQYISGAWVNVIARNYKDGEWLDLLENIFLVSATKGFDAPIVKTYSSQQNYSYSTANNKITITGSFNLLSAYIALTFDKAYNLTGYNTLEFNVASVDGTQGSGYCNIQKGRTYVRGGTNAASISLLTTGKRILDISNLSGEYYIHLYVEAYPGTASFTVDEIVLKT